MRHTNEWQMFQLRVMAFWFALCPLLTLCAQRPFPQGTFFWVPWACARCYVARRPGKNRCDLCRLHFVRQQLVWTTATKSTLVAEPDIPASGYWAQRHPLSSELPLQLPDRYIHPTTLTWSTLVTTDLWLLRRLCEHGDLQAFAGTEEWLHQRRLCQLGRMGWTSFRTRTSRSSRIALETTENGDSASCCTRRNLRSTRRAKRRRSTWFLMTSLSGKAWRQIEHLVEKASEAEDGFLMIPAELDKTFKYDNRVEMPRAFEKFFYGVSRKDGQTLINYMADHREALMEVEKHGVKVPDKVDQSGWLDLAALCWTHHGSRWSKEAPTTWPGRTWRRRSTSCWAKTTKVVQLTAEPGVGKAMELPHQGHQGYLTEEAYDVDDEDWANMQYDETGDWGDWPDDGHEDEEQDEVYYNPQPWRARRGWRVLHRRRAELWGCLCDVPCRQTSDGSLEDIQRISGCGSEGYFINAVFHTIFPGSTKPQR